MRIICISDTHNKHRDLILPSGDVLIHAGDATMLGEEEKCKDFLQWMSGLSYKTKIFVPGNHDFWFETLSWADSKRLELIYGVRIMSSRIYTNVGDFSLLGLPWSLPYGPWAFQKTEEDMEILLEHCIQPDILVSHGPIKGILDKTKRGELAGSEALLEWSNDHLPKLVVTGHIHEAYGSFVYNGSLFLNASQMDLKYNLINKPWVVDMEKQTVVRLA